MNRRERRAALARDRTAAGLTDIGGLMAAAQHAYGHGRFVEAEDICRRVLARAPAHVNSLNLLGLIAQTAGRHKNAIRMFERALALDDANAACHYNIASSHQVLGQRQSAAAHFKTAIALGLSSKNVEDFILHNSAVVQCVTRISGKLARHEDLLESSIIAAIAGDVFLECALTSTLVRGVTLETFLTRLREALLHLAGANVGEPAGADENIVRIFCAVAQQCFINEYVFRQGDEELRQAGDLKSLLLRQLSTGDNVPPLLIAAVAAYFPLHSLPGAVSLLGRTWPEYVTALLRQQVREPLEEAEDRGAIPALTSIDDAVSLQVMRQYEENPYPRWTINPPATLAGNAEQHAGAPGDERAAVKDMLIAGCGTGQHSCQVARQFPDARVLAVDVSLASLAYARRKTREAGLRNIEYAQADVLKLGAIGRTFDRIEAVGVLHHLADPEAGWKELLALLRPKGIMRVGLYSEAARRPIVEARRLIAERGYRATPEDIRKARRMISDDPDDLRGKRMTASADFYSMSGCRDLLFNVVEHRFTIPRLAAFLNEHGLAFLGFELEPETLEKFQAQNPAEAALVDLDLWDAFEAANPSTFERMYKFGVARTGY